MATVQNPITWKAFKDAMRATLWPYPGEPRNLRVPHDTYFRDAAIKLQKFNECLQVNNVTVHPFCSTYYECGKTLIAAPLGFRQFIYTIANQDFCDRVYLKSASYEEVIAWARNRLNVLAPANLNMTALPGGLKFAHKSSDSVCGRARTGIYAIHNKRVYIAPWIQSNESVVVEWDGIKKDFQDDDVLDRDVWDQEVEEAIRAYVHWKDQQFHACPTPQELIQLERSFLDSQADLIWECTKRTQQVEDRFTDEPLRLPLRAEILDDAVPAVDDPPMVFAIVGDFGVASHASDRKAVADLIRSWNPEFIWTMGDNSYDATEITLAAYDLDIGPDYHEWLFPYIGTYGQVATKQMLYGIIGNHDRDPNGKAPIFAAYFNIAGKPYNDFVKGPVNCFNLDTGYNNNQVNMNPDGVTFDSVMGQWLQTRLAQSNSPWKLVGGHHPPYTSSPTASLAPTVAGDGTLSYPELRYPFKAWGAHAYLNGHIHAWERLEVDGFPYLVNGAGGQTLVPVFRDPPLSYSQFRYNAKHGAVYATATRDSITFRFVNVDGEAIDSFAMAKDDSGAVVEFVSFPPLPATASGVTWKNMRLKADGTWEFYNRTTGKWSALWTEGQSGQETLSIDPQE